MLERGEIISYDAGAHTATIRFAGSISSTVAAVPVSASLTAADMAVGRTAAVLFFGDAANPGDSLVVGVDAAPPVGGGGADVKSGRESAITENSTRAVTFSSAFGNTPQVVVSFDDGSTQQSLCQVEGVSATGFTIRVIKIGGGGSVDRDVAWIATDAGDP